MLTRIRLQNFKSWADSGWVELGGITGLFGANSSGKSSFLQAILLMKQTVDSPDREQVLDLGDERGLVELGAFEDLLHDRSSPLGLGFAWNFPEVGLPSSHPSEQQFETTIRRSETGNATLERFEYAVDTRRFTVESSPPRDLISYRLGGAVLLDRVRVRSGTRKSYGFPTSVEELQAEAFNPRDHEFLFEEQFNRIRYLGPLREHPRRDYRRTGVRPSDVGQRGEKVVDAILSNGDGSGSPEEQGERTLELVAFWLKRLGLVESFEIEPVGPGNNLHQVWVRPSKGSRRVVLPDVGFGVSQILPVIALCFYAPPGSTVLLEQPEIHLHPSVQAGLADVLIDAMKRGVQIVVESHSEHLLRRLQRRVAEERVRPDEVRLYFVEHDGTRSSIRHLEMDTYGNISNWPEGFFGDDFDEIAAMAEAQWRRQEEAQP